MPDGTLSVLYRAYISCLNDQDWQSLGSFVHEDVRYNGERLGLSGYRGMLEADFRAISDLRFTIDLLVAEPPRVASRLTFDCTPAGLLFGIPVNGRRVRFAENVFYEYRDDRIGTVWSIIDKAAVASQV
ncbi:ester cyclase (plasmid) [Azospirillum sp. A29]|jgi:predicted ester cyclase|uniref:ester cyclase n=1 Tax=Azospirillum sp. A29 TaxID=3160606 RepID=UPI00367356BC